MKDVSKLVGFRPSIKIVDATLRDGGLVNDFKFPKGFEKVLYEASVKAGIDIMEFGYKADKDILIAINDNVPDGIDVSWVYDTNFELIFGKDVKTIVCTGLRAYEMALRIKYSSFEGTVIVEENYENAVKVFKSLNNHAYVMAVYTALQPILSILRR